MEDTIWGVLGPETVPGGRRTRTLGLGAATRLFNELAVPGLGGVWFGKQIFLGVLGVAVAERARSLGRRNDNIQVANAIEALGCWLEYRHNDRQRDDRLRGIDKLASAGAPPLFSMFGRRGFYVTQPIRMATVQALRALGLVESASERFNAYRCSVAGTALVEAGCIPRPRRAHALDALTAWVCGEFDADTDTMRKVVSPVEPLPPLAREQLRELLVRGDGEAARRRRAVTAWTDALVNGQLEASSKPSQPSAAHWHDIEAGALFFSMQASAFAVLDAVEIMLAESGKRSLAIGQVLGGAVKDAVGALRRKAEAFIDHGFADIDKTGANACARECADLSDRRVVEQLLLRDERVLRLRDGAVCPGQAFDPSARAAALVEDEGVTGTSIPLPKDISYRVRNLYLLNLDLRGQLDTWLKNGGSTMENEDE